MPTETANPMVINYGAFSLDFNNLPQTTLLAMVRRGVSHYLGSEMASKVNAFFDPDKESPETDTPEARAVKKAEFQAAAIEAMKAGTVGVSVRGPSVDPITTIIRRLAWTEIKTVLSQNKIKAPVKADDIVSFPNGDKFTREQLIQRRVENPLHAERLAKEAKKIADDQAKKNKKALESAAAEGIAGL